MGDLVLTDEQQAAVEYVVSAFHAGERLVAVRGYAGTGKTTIIPALRQALAAVDIPVAVGSPTHRAAMILKRKGIRDATTLHKQALTPYFTVEYAEAMAFLGEAVPCRLPVDPAVVHDEGVPWLIQERLPGGDDTALQHLRGLNRLYGAKKALESLGILGKAHFDGFGPKLGVGCLIIDEASMLGREQLALCQQAFPLLCLIGDPGQLPPVKDVRVLDEVPGVEMTQIHRQAADSPILQLAYAARRGEPVWTQFTEVPGAVERWREAPAQTFLQVPLIVWRNDTRTDCTLAIRQALYGDGEAPLHVGEPLICRASSAADRAEGFYNNALFRVVEVSHDDPRYVTVLPDDSDDRDDAREVYVHLEELYGDRIDPKAVVFRFGYCLTAHTAQGGEWPTVAISQPELMAYSVFLRRKPDHATTFAQWTYTALTRAKQCLGFLTQHLFTQATQVSVDPVPWPEDTQESLPMAEPSRLAPMFVAPADAPSEAEPVPLTDDIPEVPVPASVVAQMASSPLPLLIPQDATVDATMRLLEGKITDWVHGQSTAMLRTVERVYESVAACLDKIAVANDHAQYQLATALDRLGEQGVTLHGTPYTATVQALSPQGFPLTLTLHKRSAEELVQALEQVGQWLHLQGYLTPQGVVANDERLPF